jgi:uncharacterized protein YdeI (YjbR/CyaY-like superfamily)
MSEHGTASPDDLERALDADPVARDAWSALPPSHQREYLDWIDEAKRSETRRRRIGRTLEMLIERR